MSLSGAQLVTHDHHHLQTYPITTPQYTRQIPWHITFLSRILHAANAFTALLRPASLHFVVMDHSRYLAYMEQSTAASSTAPPTVRAQGPVVPGGPSPYPERVELVGRHVKLAPLLGSHAPALYRHVGGAANADLWTFMFDEPYLDFPSFADSMRDKAVSEDPLFYSIVVGDQEPRGSTSKGDVVGHVSLMRFSAKDRCVEVGSVMFGPSLQRTRAATEVYFLLFEYCFETLNIRRLEWKCNDLNAPSKRAAPRLGFTFEGIFRQHIIVKGRNRDTAWYSMLDNEWPIIKKGYELWLDDSNFNEFGMQEKRLEDCRAVARTVVGP